VLVAEVERVGTPGRCRFCRATRPKTVAAADLADLFWPLVHQYAVTTPGEHYDPHDQDAFDVGTPLHEAIQSDWAVFSDRMFVAGRAEGLLAAILDPRDPDALDLSALYTRRDRAYTARSPDDLWWEFAQYVKHERRFVLGRPPAPAPDLRDLLGAGLLRRLARRLRPGRQLYRARVGAAADGARPVPLPPSQMGAPPYALTGRGGRMNAPGIRVLYAALTRDTAVAEVRPWVGADVTVATLALARPARVVDLSDPRRLLVRSPFGHADLDAVLERAETLRVIGAAMSEPVTEDRSPIDYVPTQYAAEVIRARGYDGVVYGSALGRGRNVVLFDPDHARVDDTELVRVAGVRYRLDD
jgi:RES domain-containing protein